MFSADRRLVLDRGFDRAVEIVLSAFLSEGFAVEPVDGGDLHQRCAAVDRLRYTELEATLRAHGVREYSIFLDPETRDLFGYAEIEDDARWNAIADTEICRRWWVSMSPLMPSDPDHRPVSRDLTEVFRLDRG